VSRQAALENTCVPRATVYPQPNRGGKRIRVVASILAGKPLARHDSSREAAPWDIDRSMLALVPERVTVTRHFPSHLLQACQTARQWITSRGFASSGFSFPQLP